MADEADVQCLGMKGHGQPELLQYLQFNLTEADHRIGLHGGAADIRPQGDAILDLATTLHKKLRYLCTVWFEAFEYVLKMYIFFTDAVHQVVH